MEKRMLKLICAGLCLILVLAAALVFLKNQDVKQQTGVKVFTDHEPADIARLAVTNASGGFTVYYDAEEDGYVFDDLPANIVDAGGFFELMNHACAFGSLRLVSSGETDMDLYGLAEPAAIAAVTFTDGEEFSLAIGNREKVSGNYYGEVQTGEEKGNVYLFAEEDLAYFLLRKEDYISYSNNQILINIFFNLY